MLDSTDNGHPPFIFMGKKLFFMDAKYLAGVLIISYCLKRVEMSTILPYTQIIIVSTFYLIKIMLLLDLNQIITVKFSFSLRYNLLYFD